MLFYYIIINLLYFCSFIFIGEKICKTLCIENSLQSISNKYFQYPIVSIAVFSFLVSILVFLNFNVRNISIFFNIVIISTGFYFLINKLNDFKKYFKINFLKKEILLITIIFSYILLTLSPITDADSLAYHAYFPKKLLSENNYSYDLYNFHEQLVGLVEIFYIVPLHIKSEATLQIINLYAFISISSIFYNICKKKNDTFSRYFFLLILTSPIFLSLIYSAKPQLIFISLSLLSFCLINQIKDKINFNLVLFIIFVLIFNFLGKTSFLISSFVLIIYLFLKIFQKLNYFEFVKIMFFSLICFFPFVYFRYEIYGIFNLNFFINSLPTHLPGYLEFWNHLTKSQSEKFYPLSIFIPTSLNSLTTSFGLLPFILILFIKKKVELIVPFSLFLLMLILGIKSNRFYLEPLLWLSYLSLLNNVIIKRKNSKHLKIISSLQIIPFIFFTLAISLYFFSSNISSKQKDNILEKHAYGYKANKLINSKIEFKNKIIFNLRSLYYGKQNLIYPEFLKFTKDEFYLNKIIKENPNYIVLVDAEIENSIFKNCNVTKIYTENIITKVNRKSFLYENTYSKINFYKFKSDAHKKCF